MGKNDARSQIPAPVVTPPSAQDGSAIAALLRAQAAAPDAPPRDPTPYPGYQLAAEYATRAAAALQSNALPATLVAVRRLLRMALVCVED